MSRKFVYLLTNNLRHGRSTIELRRISMSGFFHPSEPSNGSRNAKHAAACPANSISTMELSRLPQPEIIFQPPVPQFGIRTMQLMRFSCHGKDHIVGTDQRGNTLLYNAELRTVGVLSSLNKPKYKALSLNVGDSLFVMDRYPQPSDTMSFEVLSYGHPSNNLLGRQDFYWHSLPPPPYVFEPGYESQLHTSYIRSHTVVGDSNIYISSKNIGTYSFDTATRAWSKAGDWLLPFCGRAEYVPEYNLWFGLSYDDKRLCTSNLSSASIIKPPKLRNLWEWEDDLKTPKDWATGDSFVVPLGSGKFFVARTFHVVRKVQLRDSFLCREEHDIFAVFTGVEVERSGKAGKGLRIVTHRSKRYRFVETFLHGVF